MDVWVASLSVAAVLTIGVPVALDFLALRGWNFNVAPGADAERFPGSPPLPKEGWRKKRDDFIRHQHRKLNRGSFLAKVLGGLLALSAALIRLSEAVARQ